MVAPQVPAFQVRAAESLEPYLARYDAVVVGPGWGQTGDRPERLKTLWATDLPLVIDADGLAAWSAAAPNPGAPPWC